MHARRARTEYAVGEAYHSTQQRSVSAYEKHRHSTHSGLCGARQSCAHRGRVSSPCPATALPLQRITDETGTAADLSIEAPSCALSLQEDNTIRPYAVVGPDCRKDRLPHRAHSGCADLCRAGHTGPAGDDPRDRRGSRRGKPAHSHPGAFTVHRRRRQRPGPHGELHAPGAGAGSSSPKTSRCIWASPRPPPAT